MNAVYLLDTNVVSEMAKAKPDHFVERRFADNERSCALSAPTIEELAFGLERLPLSQKRKRLARWLDGVLASFPVLPYDDEAALWLGRERARLSSVGRPAPRTDGEIAAVAFTNGLILVTRNTADFSGYPGVRVENWFGT